MNGAGGGTRVEDEVAPVPLDTLITVDRASPEPLHQQVARGLRELIESGALSPGTRLDNEVALAVGLGLSRPTVRQAMAHLVDQGLLVRRRGVGTQVVGPRVRRQIELTSLFDDLERAGRHPSTRVLTCDVVPAPDDVAAVLGVADGAGVLAVRRVRCAGDEPLAVLANHLPLPLATAAGLTADRLGRVGLYQVLRDAGVHVRTADQTIGARPAEPGEAELLAQPGGAVVLTLQRIARDAAGAPVELGRHLYRADRYAFEMTVTAP